MCGSKTFFTFLVVIFLGGLGQEIYAAPLPSKRPRLSRLFLATSLGNWQHQAQVSDGVKTIGFSGTSLALGLGAGYVAAAGPFSLVTQGQILLGSADLGFLTGSLPGIDITFTGKGLGFFGGKIDISLLGHSGEGVAWGLGIPLISTLYFKRNLGNGVTLTNRDFVQWGLFLDFRLRRGALFFNPKMGFIRNLRQYFVSMDYQWHF